MCKSDSELYKFQVISFKERHALSLPILPPHSLNGRQVWCDPSKTMQTSQCPGIAEPQSRRHQGPCWFCEVELLFQLHLLHERHITTSLKPLLFWNFVTCSYTFMLTKLVSMYLICLQLNFLFLCLWEDISFWISSIIKRNDIGIYLIALLKELIHP